MMYLRAFGLMCVLLISACSGGGNGSHPEDEICTLPTEDSVGDCPPADTSDDTGGDTGDTDGNDGTDTDTETTSLPHTQLFSSDFSSCAIGGEHQEVICWGAGSVMGGQISEGLITRGDGTTALIEYTPPFKVQFPGAGPIQHVEYAEMQNVANDAAGCVIYDGGKVRCWGYITGHQANEYNNDSEHDNAEALIASGQQDLVIGDLVEVTALTIGRISCAAGKTNAAYTTADKVFCWGLHDANLGYGTTNFGDGPTFANSRLSVYEAFEQFPNGVPLGGNHVVSLQGSNTHVCAILSNGNLSCWGSNNRGQLGRGSTSGLSPGTVSLGGRSVAEVAVSSEGTCVRFHQPDPDASGVRCWGTTYAYSHEQLQSLIGTVYENRIDNYFETAYRVEINRPLPIDIDLGQQDGQALTARQIAKGGKSGLGYTCALIQPLEEDDPQAHHAIRCWGYNALQEWSIGIHEFGIANGAVTDQGNVGMGNDVTIASLGDLSYPTPFDHITDIALGAYSSCIIVNPDPDSNLSGVDNQEVKCWGSNMAGQRGNTYNPTTEIPGGALFQFSNF